MKLVSLFGLFLLITGCEKSVSKTSTTSTSKETEALNGKSLEEVLELKYNDVSVDCSLRLQEGEKVDLTKAPTHTFSWKLPVAQKEVRTVAAKFGHLEGTMTYELALVILLDDLSYTNAAGEEFHLEYTPKVLIRSSKKFNFVNQPGLSTSSSGYEMDLVENTGDGVRAVVYSQGTSHSLSDLRCALNTKIKPDYAEQFERIK